MKDIEARVLLAVVADYRLCFYFIIEVAGMTEAAWHRGRLQTTGLGVEALTHLATGASRCNGTLNEYAGVELMARNFFTREIHICLIIDCASIAEITLLVAALVEVLVSGI